MSQKALVTGGSGFIGSNLAIFLEGKGFNVTVVDNFVSSDFHNLDGFKGDVIGEDFAVIEWKKLPAFDVVFHEQAITDTTVMDQKWMLHQNTEAFRRLLDYCVPKKIQVVYASSAGVYGNEPPPQKESGRLRPENIYGFSKLLMDRIAQKAMKHAKSQIAGLRYFNVFGPREKYKKNAASMIYQLAEQMRAGKRPRIFEFGEQERDHIYVKDVVTANWRAFESKKSGIFNVGTGRATSFNRLIEVIRQTLGVQLETEYIKNPYSFYQNHTKADVELARKVIGFKAEWTIEKGIEDYLTELYALGTSSKSRKKADSVQSK